MAVTSLRLPFIYISKDPGQDTGAAHNPEPPTDKDKKTNNNKKKPENDLQVKTCCS